jgi:hypothetical protein
MALQPECQLQRLHPHRGMDKSEIRISARSEASALISKQILNSNIKYSKYFSISRSTAFLADIEYTLPNYIVSGFEFWSFVFVER